MQPIIKTILQKCHFANLWYELNDILLVSCLIYTQNSFGFLPDDKPELEMNY